MNTEGFLFVKIIIQLSEIVLVTKRMVKFSTLMIIGSLFGSLMGIMESFASFMNTTEKIVEMGQKKKKRNAFITNLKEQRKWLMLGDL